MKHDKKRGKTKRPRCRKETGAEGKKENSAFYKLLNGKWKFKYFERDIDVPDNIKGWDTIDVPSNWQMHSGLMRSRRL